MSAEARALQHQAAHDAHEMGRRQDLADPLRPHRHAAEREHEARQQDRGQQEEDRGLHRLELVLGHRRDGEADREVGGDEQRRAEAEQREAALASPTPNSSRRPAGSPSTWTEPMTM